MGHRIRSFMFGVALTTLLPLTAGAEPADILATLDGQPITEAQADELAGQIMNRARTQWYEARRSAVDEVIARMLVEREAKRRSLSVDQLLETEVASKVGAISPDEIRDFYEKNKARIQGSLEDVRPQVERYLRQQHLAIQSNRFIQELRMASKIAYRITPPSVAVAAVGPAKGAPTAPVTIVEFSDFECFFCKRAQPMLKTLLETYGPSLRLVYRDFPMDTHPAARPAAEAARCANDQGKFWEYHDLLFANQTKLDVDSLKKYANQVSLDEEAFAACLSSRKHQATIDRDVEDGRKVAIQGTPYFFVNGRPVVGAQPIETFRAIIDEELARAQQASQKR